MVTGAGTVVKGGPGTIAIGSTSVTSEGFVTRKVSLSGAKEQFVMFIMKQFL